MQKGGIKGKAAKRRKIKLYILFYTVLLAAFHFFLLLHFTPCKLQPIRFHQISNELLLGSKFSAIPNRQGC